jgi:hypothetical protein
VVGIRAKSLSAIPFTLKYVQTEHTPVGAKGNVDGSSKPFPNWVLYESQFGPQGLLDRYGSSALVKENSGFLKTIGDGISFMLGSGKEKNSAAGVQRLGLSKEVNTRVYEVTERQLAAQQQDEKLRKEKEEADKKVKMATPARGKGEGGIGDITTLGDGFVPKNEEEEERARQARRDASLAAYEKRKQAQKEAEQRVKVNICLGILDIGRPPSTILVLTPIPTP